MKGCEFMRVGIFYSSVSGNTKLIAQTIQKELHCDMMVMADYNEEVLRNYDLLFIGYWIDKGDCDTLSKKVLNGVNGEKIALFGTLGAADNTTYYDMVKSNVEKNVLIGKVHYHFLCQGKIEDKLFKQCKDTLQKDPDNEHLKMQVLNYEEGMSHPDETDISCARKFAKKVYEANS